MSFIDRKKITNHDEVLFSGSSDPLRAAFGHYQVLQYNNEYSTVPTLYDPLVDISTTADLTMVNSRDAYALDNEHTDKLIYIQSNLELQTTASSNSAVKTHKFPIRLIGTNNGATLSSDEQWKKILLGGEYEGNEYPALINQGVFNDFTFKYEMPYSNLRVRELSNAIPGTEPADFLKFEISYDYNEYLPQYENRAKTMSELMLPNVYMLKMVDDNTSPATRFPKYITDFVSLSDPDSQIINGDETSSLFDPVSQYYPPSYAVKNDEIDTSGTDTMYEDKSYNIREYLTGAFVENTIETDTATSVLKRSKNLFFSTQVSSDLLKDVHDEIHKMPMYSKITFPIDPARTDGFSQIIRDNNLDEDFLLYLKSNFRTTGNDYVKATMELSSSYVESDDGTISYNYKSSYEPTTMKTENFLSALISIYNSTTLDNGRNNTFMGERTLDSISSENPGSKYRYYKSISALKAIESSVNALNDSLLEPSANPVKTIGDLQDKADLPADTIAYKLTKIGGSFLDSERRITSIQDIYFMNDDTSLYVDGTDFKYYDTQVKHGEQYLYTLTAYAIVKGYEYQYSDLRISRNIGEVVVRDSGSFTVVSDLEKFCTEMYDPSTGATTNQLLNTESNLLGQETLIAVGADDQDSDAMNLFRQYLGGYRDKEALRWSDVLDISPVFGTRDEEIISIPDLGVSLEVGIEDYVDETFTRMYEGAPPILSDWDGGAGRWRELSDDQQLLEIEIYKMWATKREYTDLERTFKGDGSFGDIDNITVAIQDRTKNRFATNSQFKSQFKYCADLNMSMAPGARVVEIPIATKVVKILDNPPVAPDITPFSRVDDSQIIGFFVNLESFRLPQDPTNTDSQSSIGQYPTTISAEEESKKQLYLISNDMLEQDLVKQESVSKIKTLEVHRIDYKPTSLDDFVGNLIYTKNLAMDIESTGKTNYYTNCIYEEKVQTNKKYYYFLRFLNEHGDASYFAPIQIVELIDDGGYKYPEFNVMFESELIEPTPKQKSTPFKKLLQITPDIKHMLFDDSEVDYTKAAATQTEKLIGKIGRRDSDLLWGKTFKFRITSKKTGKKIDLNIKYNLRDS